MALVSAISKNTFVTLVAKDFHNDWELRPRSRSLDIMNDTSDPVPRNQAEELQELTEQSLQRLTNALNSGVLQPSASPSQSSASRAPSPPPLVSAEASTSKPSLKSIRATLKNNFYSVAPQKVWGPKLRVSSSCSLSTMAPDDDCGASPPASPDVSNIRKAWSSGSVSSMISWAEIAEHEEVEFELDINAGAEAAQKQATIEESVASHAIGKITQAMTHGSVPKRNNMAEIAKCNADSPPTTLMIRNIPGKYEQTDLMADLNDTGFGNSYDFLYLPIDRGTSKNVGYAFVNFVDSAEAAKCLQSFSGHRFAKLQRSQNKTARVSVAHMQGLEKNLAHYQRTAVNVSKQQQRRPVIIPNISKIFS